MPPKKTHGGARINSGPPPRYSEPTEVINAFRCPKSKVQELKGIIKEFLNQFI